MRLRPTFSGVPCVDRISIAVASTEKEMQRRLAWYVRKYKRHVRGCLPLRDASAARLDVARESPLNIAWLPLRILVLAEV